MNCCKKKYVDLTGTTKNYTTLYLYSQNKNVQLYEL